MTLQGPNKDFALHTIGWQAFQDLTATIVEVDFARRAHRVAQTKDQGRDGFFYGVPDETVTTGDKRETTIQAKHFVVPTKTLTVGDLGSELASVRELAKTGRAHGYILVTNASITEANRLKIAAALTEARVERAYVLGKQWVTSKILEHPKVRALAPRVYGLGDLSWIRSEVARKQALAILDTMGEGLRRYIPTGAHRAAVDALAKHRFVLLLGDPAVGKSSIAAALSVAATDEDQCDVIFVRNPGEDLKSQIVDHRALFPGEEDVEQAVDHALWQTSQAIESIQEDREPEPDWDYERSGQHGAAAPNSGRRSIFDDLV